MTPSVEKDTPYKIIRHDGLIIAVCACGSERSVVDKGLGWAHIAAWKTQHHSCGETARVIPPELGEPS